LMIVTVYRCMAVVTLACCGVGCVVSVWCVGVRVVEGCSVLR
jgi:hypothetical protein